MGRRWQAQTAGCLRQVAATAKVPLALLQLLLPSLSAGPGCQHACAHTPCARCHHCRPAPASLPGEFEVCITTELKPQDNSLLEGLYKSSGNFCTQVRGGMQQSHTKGSHQHTGLQRAGSPITGRGYTTSHGAWGQCRTPYGISPHTPSLTSTALRTGASASPTEDSPCPGIASALHRMNPPLPTRCLSAKRYPVLPSALALVHSPPPLARGGGLPPHPTALLPPQTPP